MITSKRLNLTSSLSDPVPQLFSSFDILAMINIQILPDSRTDFCRLGTLRYQVVSGTFEKNTPFGNQKMSWCYTNNKISYRVWVLVTCGRPKSAREPLISVWRSPEEFLSWNEVYTTCRTFCIHDSKYRAGDFLHLPMSIAILVLIVLHRPWYWLQILFRLGQLGTTRLTYRFLSVGNPPLPSFEWCFHKKPFISKTKNIMIHYRIIKIHTGYPYWWHEDVQKARGSPWYRYGGARKSFCPETKSRVRVELSYSTIIGIEHVIFYIYQCRLW